MHALFDPAAMLHVLNDAALEWVGEETLAADLERGNLFLYSCGADGGATFRILLDEEPDPGLVSLASNRVAGALLRVPSGTLHAAGMEYLYRPGQEPVTAEGYAVEPEWMGQSTAIPPGDYRLDAWETPWEDPPYGRLDRLVGRATCLGCLVTLLGTVACFLAFVLGGVVWLESWPWVWFYWLVGVLILWLPIAIARKVAARSPAEKEWQQRQDGLRERFPFDVLIVLRRLPEGADPSSLRGACLRLPPGRLPRV